MPGPLSCRQAPEPRDLHAPSHPPRGVDLCRDHHLPRLFRPIHLLPRPAPTGPGAGGGRSGHRRPLGRVPGGGLGHSAVPRRAVPGNAERPLRTPAGDPDLGVRSGRRAGDGGAGAHRRLADGGAHSLRPDLRRPGRGHGLCGGCHAAGGAHQGLWLDDGGPVEWDHHGPRHRRTAGHERHPRAVLGRGRRGLHRRDLRDLRAA